MTFIDLQKACVSRRGHTALKNLTFSLNEGEHLSVIGPNGSGKTTLLMTLNGLCRLTSGSAHVLGEKLTPRTAHCLRKDIGYVPQNVTIDPRAPVSVLDVVLMGRTGKKGLLKRLGAADRKVSMNMLSLCGVSNLAFKPAGQISGGEKQKMFLARALAQEPRLLLLDEPTSSLDPSAQKEIISLVDQICAQEGITIIFVTHILEHLPAGCRKALLIKNGEIFFQGAMESALTEARLSGLYNCRMTRQEHLSYD